MKTKVLSKCAILLFCVACVSSGNNSHLNSSEGVIPVDLDRGFSKDVSVFDFCTKVELVELEEKPEAIVSEESIQCMAFGDTSIFLMGREDHLIR